MTQLLVVGARGLSLFCDNFALDTTSTSFLSYEDTFKLPFAFGG